MNFDEETLASLAADIWSSMLGLELEPSNGHMADLGHSATITGCVQITGDWSGAVTVRCPTDLAKKFAGAMFAAEPGELAADEVRDALGELTNMTGGSVKGLVPGECQLGIPAVAEGLDYSLTVPRGQAVCTVEFEHEGEPLEVIVYTMAA